MRFRSRYLAAAAVILVSTSCGGSDDKASPTTSTTATTTATAATAKQAAVLSAAELEHLVLAPGAPFVQRPDSELETGLMEVGNPNSGTIGIGFITKDDLIAAGFQRGWEKAFRAPNEAFLLTHVFQFRDAEGAVSVVGVFRAHQEPGFERFEIPSAPGAAGLAGLSDEGRTTVAVAFSKGRFLAGFTLGGPPEAMDYRAVAESLARDQAATLP